MSADFLASDSSYQQQMQRALARHEAGEAWVLPIILRPGDWQRTPLGKLVVLPLNKKAVTSWKNMDEAFQDIAIGVSQSVEHVQQNLCK